MYAHFPIYPDLSVITCGPIALKAEPESLKILARLLSDIRQSSYTPKIETRSKSSQRQSQVAAAAAQGKGKGKGKGKASSNSNNSEWLSNPLFRPTSLQELYIDTNTTTTTTTAASSDDDDSASTTDANGIGAGAEDNFNGVASTSNFNANASSKSIVDAELDLQLIWEQLELRNNKVLEIVKEIVHDGDDDEADDDAENGAEGFDDDDSDEDQDEFGLEGDEDEDSELMNGLEDEDEEDDEDEMDYSGEDYEDGTASLEEEEDDDQSMEDEDDDDEPLTPRSLSKPYFAKLRDASSPDLSSSPEKPPSKKGGKKKGSKASSSSSSTATVKPESEADDGLFSLKDFNSQVLAGEDEMNRYIQSGKSKSVNDLRSGIDGLGEDLDNESDNEEIDYFASDAGGKLDVGIGSDDEDEDEGEDEDEDEEEGGIRPEDMRYNDFWEAPSKVYTKRRDDDYAPSKNGKGKGRDFKGKGKASEASSKASTRFQGKPSEPSSAAASASASVAAVSNGTGPGAADQAESSNSGVNAKPKRRVSFHDQVKVQEIEPINGPQSNFAKLVKSVGTKKALQMLKNGEFQDGDDVDDDDDADDDDEDEDEEEEDGEEMTEEEMQALLDGEYGSDDEEDAEEDEEEEDDDDMSQASDESVNQGALTMRRLQKDLLDDDDDEDEDIAFNAITKNKKKGQQQHQSRYEARMAALSEQISALEAENVAEREWTMRGEINARARPQNSLLEEDLEFDQAAKVVPVVTEESSLSLEELIKKRILDVSLHNCQCVKPYFRSIQLTVVFPFLSPSRINSMTLFARVQLKLQPISPLVSLTSKTLKTNDP